MSDEQLYYPLSAPQQAIWYTEKFYPGTNIASISATMRLIAPIDFKILEQAINRVVENNDSLRIRVCMIGGEPRQYISQYSYKKFEIKDFSGLEKEEFFAWDTMMKARPIFAENADLFQFVLLKIDEHTYGYFATLHHLISDAWSIVMIGNEVTHYYLLLKNNAKPAMKPSYIEYLNEEKAYFESVRFQKDAEFWRTQFESLPELVGLRARKSRNIGTDAARRTFVLPPELCEKIRTHVSLTRTSMFVTFMSTFLVYFNRVTGGEDTVIGVPVFGRYNAKMKKMMGMFVTTMPLRVGIDSELSYDDYVRVFTKTWMAALRHQRYPLDRILSDVRGRFGDVEHIYDIVFSYQNAKFERIEGSINLSSRWHFNGRQNESLAININERDDDGSIIIDYDYLTGIFHSKDIDALHDHYMRLLWNALEDSDKRIREIEMVSETEKSRILGEFNNTDAPFPHDRTMLDFFEERAALCPDEECVLFSGASLTYRELNARANALARHLQSKGVKRGDTVALMLRRSFEMMVCILAAWKAGGAYLPIDPDYPRERVEYMLRDGGARVFLTVSSEIRPLEFEGEILRLDELSLNSGEASGAAPAPGDVAYIIYTSGSTGQAKGVMVEHCALVNRINWMNRKYPLAPDSVILQKTTYTFDVSVWELVWWFFAGVKMVFLEPSAEKHPDRLIDAIAANRVTTLHFVPSMLSAFLAFVDAHHGSGRLSSLREVFASGEALTPRHVNRFNSLIGSVAGARLYNLYGPTEAAIDVSYYDCPKESNQRVVPIGKPIDNIKLYIVDKHMNLQPVAVPGELCIGGVGLARGYINKRELTAEKFVENPFTPGERLYKTGDLVRWFPMGDIEYLGRMDHQVKIRGFRIELGDITHYLQQHPDVNDAVVVCRDGAKGDKYLAAYYVADAEISSPSLQECLKKHLPEYMIPTIYIRVRNIPLFSNGKANVSLLPVPALLPSAGAEREIVAPRNQTEAFILRVWSEALEVSEMSVTDNFFQMGGDSISAIKVVCQMPKPVNVSKLYEYPILEDFARNFEEKSDGRILTLLAGEGNSGRSYILCPYGGGGAYSYFDLANSLIAREPTCRVFAVNLPGHGFGEEGDFISIHDAAALILKEYAERIKGKITVYAHCVGAALGVELTRLLELSGANVEALFIGGILPSAAVSVYGWFFDPWRFAGDKRLMKYLHSIGLSGDGLNHVDSLLMLRAFRYDVRAYYRYFANYMARREKNLSVPVYTVLGRQDKMTKSGGGRRGWEIISEAPSDTIEIPQAEHYFSKTHAHQLAEILAQSSTSGY